MISQDFPKQCAEEGTREERERKDLRMSVLAGNSRTTVQALQVSVRSSCFFQEFFYPVVAGLWNLKRCKPVPEGQRLSLGDSKPCRRRSDTGVFPGEDLLIPPGCGEGDVRWHLVEQFPGGRMRKFVDKLIHARALVG